MDPANPAATPPAPDLLVDGRRCQLVWNPPVVHNPTRHPDGSLSVVFTALPSIPKGILIHHQTGDGTPCVVWVPWTHDPANPLLDRWTLLSLHPLSLREPFICSRCHMLGGIREGRWWIALGGKR